MHRPTFCILLRSQRARKNLNESQQLGHSLHLQHLVTISSSTNGTSPSCATRSMHRADVCVQTRMKHLVNKRITAFDRCDKPPCISQHSNLEAFNCDASVCSLAALEFLLNALRRDLVEGFLSYLLRLLTKRADISRVKLTCLTTV